jgi:hypothetical protein
MEAEKAYNPMDSPQQHTTKQNNHKGNSYRVNTKTLFLSGLPDDVREREIHNFFRFFHGYEGCSLSESRKEESGSKQCVAFVSFTDRGSAVQAMRCVKNVQFDPSLPQVLRVDFAKSDTKVKRLAQVDSYVNGGEKRNGNQFPYETPYFPSLYPQYSTMNPVLIPWFPNTNMRENSGPLSDISPRPHYNSWGSSFTRSTSSHIPPCTTLFVANLYPNVPERDLLLLFKTIPGFQKLKKSQKDGAPICFVEYSDIQSSANALNTLQGNKH